MPKHWVAVEMYLTMFCYFDKCCGLEQRQGVKQRYYSDFCSFFSELIPMSNSQLTPGARTSHSTDFLIKYYYVTHRRNKQEMTTHINTLNPEILMLPLQKVVVQTHFPYPSTSEHESSVSSAAPHLLVMLDQTGKFRNVNNKVIPFCV